MKFWFSVALIIIVAFLSSCISRKMINISKGNSFELVEKLGPPARTTFGLTVFEAKSGWVKGVESYRYYFLTKGGRVDCWSFYYKDGRLLSEKPLINAGPLKLLNVEEPQDRRRIELFETSNPELK